jgi:chromate transporter
VAHLAIFRDELVTRRKWLGEARYAEWVALCQFLPGPASSQLGFCLGWMRAGFPGAVAAFAGFTLPSVILMIGLATGWRGEPGGEGGWFLHGLKLVALAVVSHGLVGMIPRLCPDWVRRGVAMMGVMLALGIGWSWIQPMTVVMGGLAGLWWCRGMGAVERGESGQGMPGMRVGGLALGMFGVMLVGLPVLAGLKGGVWGWLDGMYRAGAWVFGGGHVVLPLMEDAVVRPGWISRDEFLVGYGGAQAVPGPMFSLGAYVGARSMPAWWGVPGGVLGVLALFAPGLLMVTGVVPFWRRITAHPRALGAVAGANAAVVGLLAAAWWDPVWVPAVTDVWDIVIAAIGLALLLGGRVPALLLGGRVPALLLGGRVPVLVVVGWCVGMAWLRAD